MQPDASSQMSVLAPTDRGPLTHNSSVDISWNQPAASVRFHASRESTLPHLVCDVRGCPHVALHSPVIVDSTRQVGASKMGPLLAGNHLVTHAGEGAYVEETTEPHQFQASL
jgi:hypothetical protein